MKYEEIISFHGHDCPGLAIGYRMANVAIDALRAVHAKDEELVAIVENDACGVDALQCITGCTFGKGNLLFRDVGKQVYTVYSRSTRKGVRILFHGNGISDEMRQDRTRLIGYILSAPSETILTVKPVSIHEPEPARIRKSLTCAICEEKVMETRLREIDGNQVCIPCFEKRDD